MQESTEIICKTVDRGIHNSSRTDLALKLCSEILTVEFCVLLPYIGIKYLGLLLSYFLVSKNSCPVSSADDEDVLLPAH